MRPSLDMPRGARYLVLALVSRPARAAVIAGHPRAYLAATLATAFRGLAVDPFAAQLHELALLAQAELADAIPLPERVRQVERARSLQRAARSLAVVDRVPVLTWIVRELLTDAPGSCLRLDVAVREACEKRHPITEAMRAEALAMLDRCERGLR